jgi:hypothetical protein
MLIRKLQNLSEQDTSVTKRKIEQLRGTGVVIFLDIGLPSAYPQKENGED